MFKFTSFIIMRRSLSVAFVLVLLILVSTSPSFVHGRSLRTTTSESMIMKDNDMLNDCQEGVSVDLLHQPFAVSTSNTSSNSSSSSSHRKNIKDLEFKLASGPSKRGRGH